MSKQNGFSDGFRCAGEPSKRPATELPRGPCTGTKPRIDDPTGHQHVPGRHRKEVCSGHQHEIAEGRGVHFRAYVSNPSITGVWLNSIWHVVDHNHIKLYNKLNWGIILSIYRIRLN